MKVTMPNANRTFLCATVYPGMGANNSIQACNDCWIESFQVPDGTAFPGEHSLLCNVINCWAMFPGMGAGNNI
jgi:hypothetical protein